VETPNIVQHVKRKEASTVSKRTLTVPGGRCEDGNVIPETGQGETPVFRCAGGQNAA
jgi:hypothetical protein